MIEQAPARPDVRRPSVIQTGLWAVVTLLACATCAIAALVALGVLIEPQSATIDPARLPQGTPWYTVEGVHGNVTLTECPALLGRTEASPAWCEDTDATSVRALIVAPLVALLTGACTFLAGRRTWMCVRLRSAPPPPWPPNAYRQEGMPWAFWLGLVLVGALALLIDWVTIASLLDGDGGAGPKGAVFWTAVVALIVTRYGLRSAVSVRIEGGSLEWRAPLRTRRIPLAAVVAYEIGGSSVLGERPATLDLADGATLEVSVPNRRHADVLAGFLWSLGIPQRTGTD
ncbi:MAG TPA: hypothetical protein VNQ33_08440 [Acidimicrobiales bacterium]|nr:hypothetical protein [Acidimicrobiales bacterium]